MKKGEVSDGPAGTVIGLSVKERLIISQLVPPKGTRISLAVGEEIIEKVKLNPGDIKRLALISKDVQEGSPAWLIQAETLIIDKKVRFTEPEITLLKKCIEDLEKKDDLPRIALSFAKKLYDSKVEDEQ